MGKQTLLAKVLGKISKRGNTDEMKIQAPQEFLYSLTWLVL